jgi:hypothetical protein
MGCQMASISYLFYQKVDRRRRNSLSNSFYLYHAAFFCVSHRGHGGHRGFWGVLSSTKQKLCVLYVLCVIQKKSLCVLRVLCVEQKKTLCSPCFLCNTQKTFSVTFPQILQMFNFLILILLSVQRIQTLFVGDK